MIRRISSVIVSFSAGLAAFAADLPPEFTITTIAGGNKAGFSGDGGPARAAQLNGPASVALDAAGNLYIGDNRNGRVRRVRHDGVIETFMGTGASDLQSEDGLAATATNLVEPYGLNVDSIGNVYVFSRGHSKLFKVGADGIAHVIAGTGQQGLAGDGGPAKQAQLSRSNHMVINARSEIFVADSGNQRVRKIDATGIITTYAGTGEQGFGGDGGPATAAKFNGLSAIALDSSENLYLADFDNHRIRKISKDSIVSTIAGTGDPKYNGDEIPAIQANIGQPCGVIVDTGGVVYIGDQANRRVRAITPDGIIHTVAGMGKVGLVGDNGSPAREARLIAPDILCLDAQGNVYIPDYANHAVRKLTRTK